MSKILLTCNHWSENEPEWNEMQSWDLVRHHLLVYVCYSEPFRGKPVSSRLVRKGKNHAKMSDEKFKLTRLGL